MWGLIVNRIWTFSPPPPESGIYNYGAALYEFPNDESYFFSNYHNGIASFLVRDHIAVPVPAAIWLFGHSLDWHGWV